MATGASERKQYCGMPLLTDLAVMMRIDPLALVHGLSEFVTEVYGPVMSYLFPDVQVKAYRNSVLYAKLISVVDCSVLNWMEQKELISQRRQVIRKNSGAGMDVDGTQQQFQMQKGRRGPFPCPV